MSTYISYDSDNIAVKVARLLRMYWIWQSTFQDGSRPIAGKNIAVILADKNVVNGGNNLAITAVSVPGGQHSEPVAIQRLKDLIASGQSLTGDQQVQAFINNAGKQGKLMLYTERAPCEQGPGMKNCAGFLNQSFPDVAVTHSFAYPSSGKQELDDVIRIHNSLGIFDDADCMSLRDYFRELGKQDREDVTGELKETDRFLRHKFKGKYKEETGRQIESALFDLGYLPY